MNRKIVLAWRYLAWRYLVRWPYPTYPTNAGLKSKEPQGRHWIRQVPVNRGVYPETQGASPTSDQATLCGVELPQKHPLRDTKYLPNHSFLRFQALHRNPGSSTGNDRDENNLGEKTDETTLDRLPKGPAFDQ